MGSLHSLHRQFDDREHSSGRTVRCEEEVCRSNILPADTWCSHAITCQKQLSFPKSPTHRQSEEEEGEGEKAGKKERKPGDDTMSKTKKTKERE